jgi:uncharacterized repeat protein (TIGR01451 family)
MKSLHTNREQTASFRIVSLMLAIAPLWLMLAAHAQTSNPSPGDWTQFHRDNMQRWNPYETILGVNNVGSLQVKWNNPISQELSPFSSPAVVNGVVYLGSVDQNLYALNASTGARLWSYTTGGAVPSSPAVANGVVYVGSEDGIVYALNASTGAEVWSFAAGSFSFVLSSPAVADGVVYIGVSGSGTNGLYALNANTGAMLWSFATGVSVGSSPAVVNGVVYVGSGNSMYALNASTGAERWIFATGDSVESSPAVANGVVYIGSFDHNVYALNASTGTKLWSFATGDSVESSPAVANGVVYFGSDDGVVYALDAGTGAKLWSFATGSFVVSSPAVANGVVYFGSADRNVYALNANTGARLWSYPTGDLVESSPTVVNGVVYVGSVGGLYAFELGAGADLFLRIWPNPTTVHQGDLLTYAFPVWNLGPANADQEVLTTLVPAGTTFDYIRISGTPGLGTCTHPPYQGTGQIVCHENGAMALNTTWTVRLTVKVTAPSGTVITENAATMATTPDPNMANNTATVSLTVQ